MAQSVSTNYSEAMADPHKPWDFIFAIAGWPTLYSVSKSSYTIEGDLSEFTEIKAWGNRPNISAIKNKGIPEDGQTSIATAAFRVQDKFGSGAIQELSDLISRYAYVLGQQTGNDTLLDGALSLTATTVTVDSTSGFASSGQIYIGRECINYTGTTGTTFTGCTRGYMLTDAQAHADNVQVYDFLPTVDQVPAYIYKGTRNLALTDWEVLFPGMIESAVKKGTGVDFKLVDPTWETYGLRGQRKIGSPWTGDVFPPESFELADDLVATDFTHITGTVPIVGNLNNGHYIITIGGEILAIRSAT